MGKVKFKKIAKSKIGACVITGFIAFNIGGIIATDVPDTTEVDLLKESLSEKEYEVKRLQAKVDEAKPYFEMKTEEQAQLEAQAKKEKEEREEREKAEAEAKAQAEIDAKTVELENGNFTAGEDFEAGTYDIIAISGGGNVISSNMYNGGINAIMGSDQTIAEMNEVGMGDMYKKEYKNIKLPKNTTLKLDGVTVRLVPKN